MDSRLFIDGEYILSQEGTTQGDPLGMPLVFCLLFVSWLLSKYPSSGILMMPLQVVLSMDFIRGETDWFAWV